MGLNPKQIKFCELYVKTGNATQSYIDAGYSAKDQATAQANSSRLLLNDMVSGNIKQIQAILRNDFKIDTQMIVTKLVEIVFDDVSDIVEIDERGMLNLKGGADLSRLAAVSTSESSSTLVNTKTISIKFQDKLKALDMLCKILGLYEKRENCNSDVFRNNAQRVLETLRAFKNNNVIDDLTIKKDSNVS